MNRINISIDDVSPHYRSSTAVLDRCFELMQEFEDIKFSLFVPISYWRTIKEGTITWFPLQINAFPEFCAELLALPEENFEVCYHGYHHGIPCYSDNDEFKDQTYEAAIRILEGMFEVVEAAGLSSVFKRIFRPPAWRMSPGAIRAARDVGMEVLALSTEDYAKETYAGEENSKNDVVYQTANPPLHELRLVEKTEIVYHACEWDKNYLSPELSHELGLFLHDAQDTSKFEFMHGML